MEKLCIYLTLSLDAHVEGTGATPGTVLYAVRELHDDARFVVADGKGLASAGRVRHVLQQVLRSAPAVVSFAVRKGGKKKRRRRKRMKLML